MPDTFTHIAIPSIFYRYFKKPVLLPLVLIGTTVPDYARQISALLLPTLYYQSVIIFHTMIGAVFTSVLLSAFFKRELRLWVFASLLLGQMIHFLFDMMQSFLCGGKLYLLFPYMRSLEIGLISESYWLQIFVFSVIVSVLYWGGYWFRKRKNKSLNSGC